MAILLDFEKCDFITLFTFRARKMFLTTHVHMSLYKHCITL